MQWRQRVCPLSQLQGRDMSVLSLNMVVLSFLFFGIGTAFAEDKDSKMNCHEQMKKICPGLEMGAGLGKCLHEKKDQFSSECREKGAHRKEQMEEFHKVCKEDIEKFCKINPGEGRIKKCLAKKSEVSKTCKDKINTVNRH